MTVAHSALTGAELHEPKGVAAASDGTVAQASSGAVSWAKVGTSNVSTSGAATGKTMIYNGSAIAWGYSYPSFFFLQYKFEDISTAGTKYIVIPFACTLASIYSVIEGAITTADCGLSFKNGSGTTITNAGITVTQSGSAAGDVDSSSPSANNTFTAGQTLQIVSDGASDTTIAANLVFKFTV